MPYVEALRCSTQNTIYKKKKKRQTWYAIVKTLETGSNEYFIYYF